MERTQQIETEDEGRNSGEESQDEAPHTSKTPVASALEDEDTRAGSADDEVSETLETATRASTVENENSSSSSSEDRPILSRLEMAAGTKRKAEVLSKESGKIGVTITTSSPTSPTPPPAKVSKTNVIAFSYFLIKIEQYSVQTVIKKNGNIKNLG